MSESRRLVPVATFSTSGGAFAVEIDAALFRAAEAALKKECEHQAQLAAAEPKPPTERPTVRTLFAVVGAKASGFFA